MDGHEQRTRQGAVLLHICCGPCATATERFWRGEGLEVAGFFFNPNIQPLLEYRKRLEGARALAEARSLVLLEDLSYDPALWFRLVGLREGPERCRACIGMRLTQTAERAAQEGYAGFTTSLAISPWQDHDAIREGGAEAAARCGLTFYYEDLRPFYRESRVQARELNLYRQQYCGCLLSEWERYRDA